MKPATLAGIVALSTMMAFSSLCASPALATVGSDDGFAVPSIQDQSGPISSLLSHQTTTQWSSTVLLAQSNTDESNGQRQQNNQAQDNGGNTLSQGSDTGGTAAALDCSNQSHPDCPRPSPSNGSFEIQLGTSIMQNAE